MRLWAIALLATPSLAMASDEQQLALMLKAQSQFDRVQMAATPNLRDTSACIQTQASLLPVAVPAEQAPTHFRKGFCTLAEASVTGRADEYGEAAAEFDKAIETWPLRATKNQPAEPMPAGLRVLGAVARLEGNPDNATIDRARKELAAAESAASCVSNVMPPGSCQMLLAKGREWLGWLALRNDDTEEAAKQFAGAEATGWTDWTTGRQAFASGRYPEAVRRYQQAIAVWRPWKAEAPTTSDLLSPKPDLPAALVDLGGAQLLANDTSAAIATLNEATKLNPAAAKAMYLRAMAKEKMGDGEGAMTDYNLASRAAFAGAKDLASGEAHFYRGILFFRRKNFPQAEEEFSSALNLEISGDLGKDAAAWRHLSAVVSGSCSASREHLERSLMSVCPYFPKDEARAAIATCASNTAKAVKR